MDLEKLKAHLESEEGKKSLEEFFRKWNWNASHGSDRVSKMIKDLSDEDLEKWMNKLFEWEEKWEDMKYKQGVQTSSRLFNCVYAFVCNEGKRVDHEWEDFLSSADEWRGYMFKLYQGQGSFIRVMKDGKNVFQTT